MSHDRINAAVTPRRVSAETLPHLTEQDRIAGLISAKPEGTAWLLADVADAGAGKRPTRERGDRMRALLRGAVKVASVGLVALGLAAAATVGVGSQAQAQAFPDAPRGATLTVVVARPRTSVSLPVTSTRGRAPVMLWAPSGPVAWGTTSLVGWGAVSGVVDSRGLAAGRQRWELDDASGDPITPVTVDVLRQSTVTISQAWALPGGVVVGGRAAHYDIATGKAKGDLNSQVAVQILRAGRWVTVAQAMTAADGSIAAYLPAAPGRTAVRLVRARGANVTGGTSAARTLDVPDGV